MPDFLDTLIDPATDPALAGYAGPLDTGGVLVPTPVPPDTSVISTVDVPGVTAGGTMYAAPIGPPVPSVVTTSAGSLMGGANLTIPAPGSPTTPGITTSGDILGRFLQSVYGSTARAAGQAIQGASGLLVTSIPGISVARNQRPAAAGFGGNAGLFLGVAAVAVVGWYAFARR